MRDIGEIKFDPGQANPVIEKSRMREEEERLFLGLCREFERRITQGELIRRIREEEKALELLGAYLRFICPMPERNTYFQRFSLMSRAEAIKIMEEVYKVFNIPLP
ncbi:MAG: hypothetical protein ABIC19_01415 [Patescibacteria group bacterium]|nr:hypothetical protein [Patescibacteria group bacterium]